MNLRLWIIISLFVFIPKIACASVIFTEVFYDAQGTDTDHEWVEIKNTGTEEVSLSGWKFFDGSNHLLNEPPQNGGQGSLIIPANGFAALTGNAEVFKTDHSGFSGTVIDTVMSLGNTADTIKLLYEDGTEATTLNYDTNLGANGDGNSLQLVGSSWGVGAPSPGQENSSFGTTNTSSETTTSSINTTDSKDEKTPTISAEIKVFSTRIFTGIPLSIKAEVLGYDKNPLHRGYFVFNLGDGTLYTSDTDENFLFTYNHPGEYALSFDYYWNQYGVDSIASDRIVLTVVDPQIQINAIYSDGSVEMENLSDIEIDLEHWTLTQNEKVYSFPKRSILLPKKKMIVRTSFGLIESIYLKTIDKTIVATYPKIISKQNVSSFVKTKITSGNPPNVIGSELTTSVSSITENQQDIGKNTLENKKDSQSNKNGNTTLFFIVLVLFAGVASYILFSKKQKSEDATLIHF